MAVEDIPLCNVCSFCRRLLLREIECDRDRWRADAIEKAVRIEELEHEIGELKGVLRGIIGYVDSVRWVAALR